MQRETLRYRVPPAETVFFQNSGVSEDRKDLLFSSCCAMMQKNKIAGYSGVGTAPHLGCGDRAFESHYSDQFRNSRHRSVFGFAENCALAGISSLSAAIRFAGFAAEEDGGAGFQWLMRGVQ